MSTKDLGYVGSCCLLYGLSALILGSALSWASTFVFLHDVGSKVLRFRATLAVVLGSCSYAYIPFFPLFFPCNLYLSVFSCHFPPLRLWVLISVLPWFCISATMQFTVLLGFGFVLSWFRGLWLESRSPIILHSVPNTSHFQSQSETSFKCNI